MNENNNGHWWEFYGVRYAQGTVVGAMIVFFLFSRNEALKNILFIPSEPKDFGMPHLILLAVYGLAYCYIASAPILIMHAGRGLLFKSTTNTNVYSGWRTRLFFIFTPPIISIVVYQYMYGDDELNTLKCLALFIYVMLISFQLTMLYSIFYGSWKKTIDYYLVTISKRNQHKESGYIESYKHIREHGNSFLIVTFQFFLACPIFIFVSQPEISNENAVRHLSLIVLFWIMPAATIWLFGNKLETHLQDMN